MHSPDLFASTFTLLLFSLIVLTQVFASILILWLISGFMDNRTSTSSFRWARLAMACEKAMKMIGVLGRFVLVSMAGIWLAKFMLYILLVPLP